VFAYHSRNFPRFLAEAKAGTKGIEPSFAERHSAVVTIGPCPQKKKYKTEHREGLEPPVISGLQPDAFAAPPPMRKEEKVGMAGLEPAASTFVESRAIHLRHIPKDKPKNKPER
jgi:hypothetical protein